MEIALPDNPDWTSFKFKLLKTEKMNCAAWGNLCWRSSKKQFQFSILKYEKKLFDYLTTHPKSKILLLWQPAVKSPV